MMIGRKRKGNRPEGALAATAILIALFAAMSACASVAPARTVEPAEAVEPEATPEDSLSPPAPTVAPNPQVAPEDLPVPIVAVAESGLAPLPPLAPAPVIDTALPLPPAPPPAPPPEPRRETSAAVQPRPAAPPPEPRGIPPPAPRSAQTPEPARQPASAPEVRPEAERAAEQIHDVESVVGREFTILLPGTGWIFLPDRDSPGRMESRGRRLMDGGTAFVFVSYEAGDFTMRFQQQDFSANILRYTTRSLRVVPTRPQAPRALAAPAAEAPGAAPQPLAGILDAPEQPVAGAAAPAASPAELEIAQLERRLEDNAARGVDALLFRLGQLYEQDGPTRDIRRALAAYRRVVDEHPLSPYWSRASQRVLFINRHYFELR